jgi:hypothetical protein
MKKKVANTAAVAKSELSQGDSVTVVCMALNCSVTYEFDTRATAPTLALRYMVSINGEVLPTNQGIPRVLNGSRMFTVPAHPGNTVALYLNSDASADYRLHPVYAVTVGENDVHIKITERKGRTTREFGRLGEAVVKRDAKSGKDIDTYEADLTGDVWMDISHQYTEEEADALLPKTTDATIRDAILSIYKGLPSKELVLKFPKSESSLGLKMKVCFDEVESVRSNTTYCPLLTSILPRTHPHAYLALLVEAREAEVTALNVTSGWRPMLGSIVHRAGLGLDINYVECATEKIQINRNGLRDKKANRNANISDVEKDLFSKYELAIGAKKACDDKVRLAEKSVRVNRQPEEEPNLKAVLAKAKSDQNNASIAMDETKLAWDKERDTNERALIRTLRSKLDHNKLITQVLDPWYMDFNTHDAESPTPNQQKSQDEVHHNNHLHITVAEPKIL